MQMTDKDSFVAVAHDFVRASASAETFEDVYHACVKVFSESMHIEHSAVFEVVPDEKQVYCCAARTTASNLSILQSGTAVAFGEGLIGTVAQDQQSILVSDCGLQNHYQLDPLVCSALCVPVQLDGELFGVICSFHQAPGFFHDQHRKLFELVAEIAASLLARIRQKIELNNLKMTLEQLLEEKKEALHIAVETVSNQFSELKFQRDKREVLLREVHHRVNNNLQIISSLVSLYLSETKEPGHQTLREIQARIQILSSIHLILLKSLELDEISLPGFLADLSASLRYNSVGNYLSLNFTTFGIQAPFSFNTLIPMGMLIHELVQLAIRKFWKAGELVELGFHIANDPDSGRVQLEMRGENCEKAVEAEVKNENVQQTIIRALCEQLEGELIEAGEEECRWKFAFKEV